MADISIVQIRVPKDIREIWRRYCEFRGMTLKGLIVSAVNGLISRDEDFDIFGD